MLFDTSSGLHSFIPILLAALLAFVRFSAATIISPSPTPISQQISPPNSQFTSSSDLTDAYNVTEPLVSPQNPSLSSSIPAGDSMLLSQQAAQECRGATLNTTISAATNSMTLRWNLQALQKNIYAGPPQDLLECSLSLSLGAQWQFAARTVEWVGRAKLPKPGLGLKTNVRFTVGNIPPKKYSWTLPAPSERNFVLKGEIAPANRLWTACGASTPDPYTGSVAPPLPMSVDWTARLLAQDQMVQGGILWIPPPENQPFHLTVGFDLRPCPGAT